MSIFKGLASRRTEEAKSEKPADPTEAQTSPEGNLVDMREHMKSGQSGSNNLFADEAEAAEPAQESSVRNMWDLISDPEEDLPPLAKESPASAPAPRAEAPAPKPEVPAATPAPAPSPAAETPTRRTGRVKTRLLGFDHSNGSMEEIGSRATAAAAPEAVKFPVGWLVVVEGPGRGASFALGHGVSQIGRGEDQAVALDFGDTAISRERHAMVAYDDETRSFFLGHGGKSNLVRLNGKPVLSTENVSHGDMIRVGETTLMLAALCGESFSWDGAEKAE